MKIIALCLFLHCLLEEVSPSGTSKTGSIRPGGPFLVVCPGGTYRSPYSSMRGFTIVSTSPSPQSNCSITLGGRQIGSFTLPAARNNMSVRVQTGLTHMPLSAPPDHTKLHALCRFSYPVTVVAEGSSYKCVLTFRDSRGLSRHIGACPLNLQYEAALCAIEGNLDGGLLANKRLAVLTATVYRCGQHCDLGVLSGDWKAVVNFSLEMALTSQRDITWVRSPTHSSRELGLIIGVPNSPISLKAHFEIPIRLDRGPSSRTVENITVQVRHSKFLTVKDVLHGDCFHVEDYSTEEDSFVHITDVVSQRQKGDRCNKGDQDLLFVLKMSASEDLPHLEIEVTIEKAFLKNTVVMKNITLDKTYKSVHVQIPLFQGKYAIIPMMNNPVVLPSLDRLVSPYQLKTSDLRIYHIYENIGVTDVSTKVKCRPFSKSTLRCPPDMQPLNTTLPPVTDLAAVQWSLELIIDDILVIATFQPLIMPDPQWILTFPDSVLNLISGWKAIRRSHDASLQAPTKCQPVYQVGSIQLSKRMHFHNLENAKKVEVVLDLSEIVKAQNIRLSKDIAVIHSNVDSMVVQGINPGNLDVELHSDDHYVLVKGAMMVYDNPVSIRDLEISCVSSVIISRNVSFCSNSVCVMEVNLKMQNGRSPRGCFLTIDIVFSDDTRSDIFAFPSDQYALKFITNTKVIEVSDPLNMWYDYNAFDKADSFSVELQESRHCENRTTIFKKMFSFSGISSTDVSTPPNVTLARQYREPLSKKKVEDSDNRIIPPRTFKGVTLIVIAVICVVTLVISIHIAIRCYRKKKEHTRNPGRRKSLNGYDVGDLAITEKNYPPLLPPPGPQVHLSDPAAVAISSPHSFWCLDPKKARKAATRPTQFVRQNSLPVKEHPSRGCNEIAPCPPLRWANRLMPESSVTTSHGSQEALNSMICQEIVSCSPMTWSVTNMDLEGSSGVGSLTTNIDDLLKDPYGSKERFHKLSELPCSISRQKEHVYDMI